MARFACIVSGFPELTVLPPKLTLRGIIRHYFWSETTRLPFNKRATNLGIDHLLLTTRNQPGHWQFLGPEGWFWRMFPRNENRNESIFGCPPRTKTRTRVHLRVPPEPKPERGHIRQNHPFTKPPFSLPVKVIVTDSSSACIVQLSPWSAHAFVS